MDRLREWAFPAALIVGWMIAAAYAMSLMIGPLETTAPPGEPPAVADDERPAMAARTSADR